MKQMEMAFALLWLIQGSYRKGRVTHVSGLTEGFQWYPYFLFSGSGLAVNPEKQKKKLFSRFALFWLKQGTYGVGKGTPKLDLT